MWLPTISFDILHLIGNATLDTLYMVMLASFFSGLIGIPTGIFLATSRKGELFAHPSAHAIVGAVANALRSTPFIILAVSIIPLTRFIAGTSIGPTAAVVPLTIAAFPFVARLVESAVREVDYGLIEAARSMGATPLQIVRKILLPEAQPGIILGLTLAVVSLIGYSAIVGVVGGGGLGDLGIRYGYQRFMPEVMLIVVVILIALVQTIQGIGDKLARRANKRIKYH